MNYIAKEMRKRLKLPDFLFGNLNDPRLSRLNRAGRYVGAFTNRDVHLTWEILTMQLTYALTRDGIVVCIFGAHSRALDAFKFYASEYPQHKWLIELA